ncbi:hypothetical protein [Pelagicoccus sp. SDUM812003]|uniref:hypothetical protein n=1 Tax=Pelagicoccus sp. SDUM812003 TaxID=3041267 RepID=UPI00280F9612|nr:hypothetical protein [Pelagicoccus sp. SDUM812003]MDQ8202596.1 hypothetical protein [Pelagicoccus sp. SDUM812003]
MKLKGKSLCGLKKVAIKEHLDEIQLIVCKPKFICGKCARVAAHSGNLCRARKLTV